MVSRKLQTGSLQTWLLDNKNYVALTSLTFYIILSFYARTRRLRPEGIQSISTEDLSRCNHLLFGHVERIDEIGSHYNVHPWVVHNHTSQATEHLHSEIGIGDGCLGLV